MTGNLELYKKVGEVKQILQALIIAEKKRLLTIRDSKIRNGSSIKGKKIVDFLICPQKISHLVEFQNLKFNLT